MRKLIEFTIATAMALVALVLFISLGLSLYQYELEQTRLQQVQEKIQEDIPRYVVAPHVIRIDITLPAPDGMKVSGGTGFHLEYQGKVVIMTNKHICDPTLEGMELRHDNNKLEVIKISKEHDLCLIKSDRSSGLTLANVQHQVDIMDKVILVGHPRGLPLTIREGRIMTYDYSVFPWIHDREVDYYMISATAYGGNSGSPVTDPKGNVIGVLFAGYIKYHTESMVVPLVNLHVLLGANYELY